MSNVVVVGANGRTAREIIPRVGQLDGVALTLFLRRAERVADVAGGMRVIEGDALDPEALDTALHGQDTVIVALGGPDLDKTTAAVVAAAKRGGVRRIITINAGGIYDELPEPFNSWDYEHAGRTRPVNRRAANVVEQSSLDYTILRPVWLTNKDVTDVELTQKGDTYNGTETSRASLGQFIAALVADPGSHVNENLGITQPGTDGDRPAAYR